ncbi:AraC family transcriptional regulator ligand-binding domain-containing protein [Bacterioplanoides sp.]|uniref:helix-turn-helix transcriptional regulator n=1 Tax=Bacterioplanoides sp. TaxID=2066072 RepID=UPI003B004B70
MKPGHIHKSYVLIAMLLELVPTRQLFAATQINLETLSETDSVPLADCIQLVHNLLQHNKRSDIAMEYGRHLGMVSHGPVGYATLSAPTIGQALETFVRWFRIRCDIYQHEIRHHAEHVDIVLHDTTGDPVFAQFFFMTYMRTNEILIKQISGAPRNTDIELYFTHHDSRSTGDQESFDAKLHFAQAENKLRVPKVLWQQASPLHDQAAFEANLQKCEQLLAAQQSKTQLHVQVRQLIRQCLEDNVANGSAAVALPSLEQICDRLHLSRRSLIRKLKQHNTSYLQIVQQERLLIATLLLQQARYTVYEIACLLGYGESANFCRAFKNWTGKSPKEFRRSAG